METKKITIAMVSVIVAVLLISGIVVPIIADATKGKETTGWVERTGDVPGAGQTLEFHSISNEIISNNSYLTVWGRGDYQTYIDDREYSGDLNLTIFPLILWADNNIIIFANSDNNSNYTLSIIDLTPEQVFSDQPIMTEYDNAYPLEEYALISLQYDPSGHLAYYVVDPEGYVLDFDEFDILVHKMDYAYFCCADTPDYALFNQNPNIIPPTNPNPSVSVGDAYIGLTSGTYQAKETVTEEAPISVRMLVIVPLLMAVGLVIATTGLFIKRQ